MVHDDKSVTLRAGVLIGGVGIMWLIHALDAFLPRGWSVVGTGIVPRTLHGLYGIPVAPLIHASWGHLISNSVPLLILGAIVLFRGVGELVFVTLCSVLIGGVGTWLFGEGNAQHIGASGLVFGLFGYLVFRSAFDRKLTSAVVTLVVAILYGGAMAHSLIPSAEVSWSSHFFGFLGGCVAARLRYPARQASDLTTEAQSRVVELTRRW